MLKKSPATFTLIAINLVIFGWLVAQLQSFMMDSSTDVLAILHRGANLNPFTLGGEPWRIFTSLFLHFGIYHLLINMLALFSMGRELESDLGTPRFVLVYFLCGIGASLSSLLFNVYTISAGASGALFGLYGYRLGGEVLANFHDRRRLLAVLLNFSFFVLINALITSQFSVDLAGHVGGGICGLLLVVLHVKLHGLWRVRDLAIALILFPLSLMFFPRDQLDYYRIFQRVLRAERHNNRIFRNNLDDVQMRDSLTSIIVEWDAIGPAIAALSSVRPELLADTTNLHRYAQLRRTEAVYRIALIEKESYIYTDSLEVVSDHLNTMPPFAYNLNFALPDFPPPEDEPPVESVPLTSKRVFYDAVWKEMDDPSASSFYRIGTMDSLGRWQGPVRDYFHDGTIQMKGNYLDDLKHGIFLYYTERGTYSSAGRYVKEEAVGKWESFHWNGALENEVYYEQGAHTRTVRDSLGRLQVENGNGKYISWHPNGQVAEEGHYRSGRRVGDWVGYYENGAPYFRELYRDNRLVNGVSEDRSGKRYVYDHLSLYPFPVVGMDAYRKYLREQVVQGDGSHERGVVKIIFNVGVDGSIWDFVILQGLTRQQDLQAIQWVKDGPEWRPGLLHGQTKLPSQGYVEVNF